MLSSFFSLCLIRTLINTEVKPGKTSLLALSIALSDWLMVFVGPRAICLIDIIFGGYPIAGP